MEDPRWKRIAKRPERDHLPFEWGRRTGPLFAPTIGALLIALVAGCIVAAFLTTLLSGGRS